MSEYTRLANGRVIYTQLFELFEHVESLGCELSLDRDGEVCVTNDDRLELAVIFELQSNCHSVESWLKSKGRTVWTP
jgi:hypothetical protein